MLSLPGSAVHEGEGAAEWFAFLQVDPASSGGIDSELCTMYLAGVNKVLCPAQAKKGFETLASVHFLFALDCFVLARLWARLARVQNVVLAWAASSSSLS